MASGEQQPLVGVIMGSDSDLPTMQHAFAALDKFSILTDPGVVSAHRTPKDMMEYAGLAASRNLKVLIAGAGGSAHLPGMVASETTLPVCGVAIESSPDPMQAAVGSQIRMPKHKPLAYLGKGEAGAWNAGIFAVKILALLNPALAEKLKAYDEEIAEESRAKNDALKIMGPHAYLLERLGVEEKKIAPDLL